MNRDEKYLARKMFQNQVYASDGQAFEDLFVAIMVKAFPNFTPVKPQGPIGDRKNDGFNREKGWYYQVFAPEDIHKSQRKAVVKINEDFNGLRAYWDNICPIKRFFFVVNDKYKGVYPSICEELDSIKKKFALEDCGPFLAKDLENNFFELSDDDIVSIIGLIPNPENIDTIDYSVLNEMIRHIICNERTLEIEQLLSAPDFDSKILFNGLGRQISTLLHYGAYQAGLVDGYFEMNSDFTKQDLRNILNERYRNSRERHMDGGNEVPNIGEIIFFRHSKKHRSCQYYEGECQARSGRCNRAHVLFLRIMRSF